MKNMMLRVDSCLQRGSGHVMRCLALAQAWKQENGKAIFLLSDRLPHSLEQRILEEGFALKYLSAASGNDQDALTTVELMSGYGCEWVVIDGYQFDMAFQERLKDAGRRILAFDDYGHVEHCYADLVLNQNITATPAIYPDRESYTRLLLGTNFAVLRKEFWEWRSWRREIPEQALRLLITLGGSAPHNLTEKIIKAVRRVNFGLEITVVTGVNQSTDVEKPSRIGDLGQNIRFVSAPSNMPKLMADADIAISAGGSTCWELAFMGLPSMIVSAAENQRGIGPALAQAGAAIHLGWADSLQPSSLVDQLQDLTFSALERTRLSNNGRTLVDSYGSMRVLQAISGRRFVYLRGATMDDSRMIWMWANDPETRSASFSTAFIPWETHSEWFSRKMADPQHLMWIALNDSMESIGLIRYQIEEHEASVSINLAPQQRGAGYGSQILRLGTERIFRGGTVHAIHAYIKPANMASKKVFRTAGFVYQNTTNVESNPAEHYLVDAGSISAALPTWTSNRR